MSSISEGVVVGVGEERGFPSKCHCGLGVLVFTAKTQDNPGRPFFRCKSKKDEHLFKWVEEAVCEEVEDGLARFGQIESEIEELKLRMKAMEQSVWLCKIGVCVLGGVVIYQMFGKGK